MTTVQVDLPEDLPRGTQHLRKHILSGFGFARSGEVAKLLALELFREGALSLGRAAEQHHRICPDIQRRMRERAFAREADQIPVDEYKIEGRRIPDKDRAARERTPARPLSLASTSPLVPFLSRFPSMAL